MVHAPAPFPLDVPIRVNLYSDTQTKPTRAMRDAMMAAEVGDEQSGTDPTVNALCARMAALLGKEAAMFLPSGTMCNEVAILVQCRPGDEILAHGTAHIIAAEGGAPAALAGVQVTAVPGARGMFDVAALAGLRRNLSRNSPPQRMVEVEQTANLGGGAVWDVAALDAVAGWAHGEGMVTHMDGARLMNAVVATGSGADRVEAARMAAGFDTVWLDFTKGLGAPLGAVLAGTEAFIGEAWRWKQRLGGALRQAGMNAAACLHALDHHVERLAEDHANARALAAGLRLIPGITAEEPDTNLVFFSVSGTGLSAEALARRARRAGVLISVMGPDRCRACTHLDVDRAGIEEALAVVAAVAAERFAA